MKTDMAKTARADKPPKARRAGKRFHYHECYHHDAWIGLQKMTPEQTGVYWRIILLTYINKAALSDADDVETARLCHTPTKTFRRIKRELIALGRIEHDEENRIFFDKRAIEELTALGFFSMAQSERALKRWADTTPKPRVVVDNVGPLSPENRVFLAESPEVLGVSSIVSQTTIDEKQTVSVCRTHANQNPITNIDSLQPVEPASGRAAQPLGSGGAPEPRPGGPVRDRAKWLADQAARLGLTAPGKDEGAAPVEAAAPSAAGEDEYHPADRIARRRA